jgi:anti-sigma B factor antagonist
MRRYWQGLRRKRDADMEIAHEHDGEVIVVKLTGRLDSSTAKAAEDGLSAAIAGAEGPRVVIDLTGLTYVSSAGLRVLLLTDKKIKAAAGRLALCGLGASVREVFTISGFDTLLALQPGRSAAIAAVR